VNPIAKLWCKLSSLIVLMKIMSEYFKVVKTAMVQVLGSIEDEHIFSTLSFTESKLQN